eukprot:11188841-Lingulodinium_polyedra.AAC.1
MRVSSRRNVHVSACLPKRSVGLRDTISSRRPRMSVSSRRIVRVPFASSERPFGARETIASHGAL